MNEQKRFFLFLMISFLTMIGLQIAMEQAGFFPKPEEKTKAAGTDAVKKADGTDSAKKDIAKNGSEQPGKSDADSKSEPAKTEKPAEKQPEVVVAPVKPESVELGSKDESSGYLLNLGLTNIGSGVTWADSSRLAADHLPGQSNKEKLRFVQTAAGSPDSLTLEIRSIDGEEKSFDLSKSGWELVRESSDATPVKTAGDTQSVQFRLNVQEVPGLTITRTYTLAKGKNSFSVDLQFTSTQDRSLVYRLLGPYGLPLEGQWYSYTYRDLFFAPVDPRANLISRSSAEVAKATDPESGYAPEVVTTPLRYAGVETQYFANFVQIVPTDGSAEPNLIAEATERLIGAVPKDPNKSNIGIALTSNPLKLTANEPIDHHFEVFLGPKSRPALRPYNAEELTTYRRGWAIPGSRALARSFISPMLDTIYTATKSMFGVFGATRGSYGLAIILLTAVVRMMIFPFSRKQAITSKRMQDLAPQLAEIKEKYKDDKERQGRETMDLYRQAGVNPFSGCLIAMIQLPVFMGLWQTLNNSVALRHAPFLYIDNLAAPDALFRFPGTIPFLGDYFNFLPLLSAGLMFFQMRLFSPPPANEEAEMQQKMMSVMMIFMSFMFYKVPSGLGLYFITSSLWALCERLILPKFVHSTPVIELSGGSGQSIDSSAKVSSKSSGSKEAAPATGWRARLQKMVEDAEKQRTIQNENRNKSDQNKGGKSGKNKGKR